MASAKALNGVRKWLGRDEWRKPFDDLIDLHLGIPCEEAGLSLQALEGAVDDDTMAVLYGCVFEDMLASEFDDGANIVDDYIKRRGWKESVPNKRYLAGLRHSVMSLYEVSDIVRDQSFLARDLLRGGEPVRVSEKRGTHSLKQWDRVAARLVRLGDRAEMAGGLLRFRHEQAEELRAEFAGLVDEMRSKSVVLAQRRAAGTEPGEFALHTEILRESAYLFTNIWLSDLLGSRSGAKLPEIRNSDGDPIAFATVRYPLRAPVDRAALEAALATVPGLLQTGDDLWTLSEAPPRRHGNTVAAAALPVPEDGMALQSMLPDGSISVATVALEDDRLEVEANSSRRAEKVRALLDPAVGRFAGPPETTIRTLAEAMASRPERTGADAPPSRPAGMTAEEERRIVHEFLDQHYRRTLDEPVPVLGNVTPRAASRTAAGREKLVEWLKMIENGAAGQDADRAMAGYDVGWMWEELGMAKLRR